MSFEKLNIAAHQRSKNFRWRLLRCLRKLVRPLRQGSIAYTNIYNGRNSMSKINDRKFLPYVKKLAYIPLIIGDMFLSMNIFVYFVNLESELKQTSN